MDIQSPVAYGNGAYVVHKALENKIKGYNVKPYNPYLTLFPPLIKLFDTSSADIIHAPVDYSFFSYDKNRPLISTFHSYVLDQYLRSHSSFMQNIHYRTDLKYFIKKSLEVSTMITAVSEYLARKVREDLGYEREIRIIYNGVDTDKLVPQKKIKSNKNPVKLLFCGNPTPKKGAQYIPQILDNTEKNIELIYTSGPGGKNHIIKHPKARCVGKIDHSNINRLYAEADILLFPSMREGFGLVIAEAMACGLPVIATNCSAIPELIVDSKGGYLCEPGDVSDFADRINALANSHIMRKEMGEFNRTTAVEKFHIDLMTNRYKLLFEEILSY
jgi:L-malate glycosyltransferase